MGANGQSPYTSAPFAMSRTNLYTADFNNDGRTDFLDKISGTQYKRYFSKNNGFDAEETKNLRTFAHYDYKMGGAGATKHACTYDFVLTDLYGMVIHKLFNYATSISHKEEFSHNIIPVILGLEQMNL